MSDSTTQPRDRGPRIMVPTEPPRSAGRVGPLIDASRRFAVKLTDPQLRAVADLVQSAVDALGARLDMIEEHVAAETGLRERAQQDIQSLAGRLGEIERMLGELQLGPRLARLERRPTTATPSSAAAAASAPAGQIATSNFDYLAFEARFRGDEATIRERQAIYVELLRDRKRVVDLGCGRGELLELLRAEGVSAYGVEMEEDFVGLVSEKGLDVVAGDLFAHVEGLAASDVDAIVLSHVIEHFSPPLMTRFVQGAYDALANGGVLIIETPNPESLLAGSVNFLRDPTHIRPVHPDTLQFFAQSAGFDDVVVRRLSPVPAGYRLAPDQVAERPELADVAKAIARIDSLLFGFQDYAVVATRTPPGR